MKTVKLNNGIEMPLIGFGVYRVTDPAECERCVGDALEAGYRLVDTASAYGNEAAVGKAIRESGIRREELFVTTKLWVQDHGYENTKKAFQTSLDKLGLDYLDLYLIHQCYGDYYGAWRAMEELYQEGKIRAIGVSNFYSDRLVDLILHNQVIPAIDQVELHPFFHQKELMDVMREYGVQIEAWGPFAQGERNIFQNEVLSAIGKKYNKSVGQVILRWDVQRGVVAIPKSTHKNRIQENCDIWDFVLTEDDMTEIDSLDLGKPLIDDHRSLKMVKWLSPLKIHP